MPDASKARRRLLTAATAEFAARGIAGARVDRIAETAGVSKPMLYTYFGPKEQLFEEVFQAHVIANGHRVPFHADDLAGYAVALYDDYLTDPALLRLVTWKRLENTPDGYLFAGLEDNDADHLDRIREQQQQGSIRDDIDAVDIWSLLISMAATWAQASITVVGLGSDGDETHQRRRRALAAAVESGLCALGSR